MPIVIQRPPRAPQSREEIEQWSLQAGGELLAYLRALTTLDRELRATRSLNAEQALIFTSAVVTSAAVLRLADLVPGVVTETYTTAQIQTDAGSGAARWRIDGGLPVAAATAAAGMPLLAAGGQLTIVGQLNIRNFAVIAEAAAVNLSVTLFQ